MGDRTEGQPTGRFAEQVCPMDRMDIGRLIRKLVGCSD